MLDHLLIYTAAELIDTTVSFYVAALAPLGYKKMSEFMDGAVVGMGDPSAGHPDFWIASIKMKQGQDPNIQPGYAHFAFRAKERKIVNECHAKGLEAGGRDNGAPGLRPQYHADYYAGFLYDPAGNGVEFCNRTDVESSTQS
ncbi:MAG: hypothetical protein M1831_004535 [Alyxoria varia]|nr:MAG: hypothetical protein M1831_004535 [Alyxoria varia]